MPIETEDSNASAEASHARGVTIEYLISFTNEHDCWNWPTSQVVSEKIKPMTAEAQCRFTDLPEVRATGAVGPAITFACHCWSAKWGLLVAALADGADPQRRVWVDVFAVRQWPDNAADLCFSEVVSKCRSLVVVAQAHQTTRRADHLTCLGDLTIEQMKARQSHLLPLDVQRSIPYLRIWVTPASPPPRRTPQPHALPAPRGSAWPRSAPPSRRAWRS